MISFKSLEDLNKLSPTDPAYPVVKELIEQLIEAYTCENNPYVAGWETAERVPLDVFAESD